MSDTNLLSPWIRRFLLEYLVGDRNLSPNTQKSYRDTLRLLLPFAARIAKRPLDQLMVEDLTRDCVRAFLDDLEENRQCSVAQIVQARLEEPAVGTRDSSTPTQLAISLL